jgi:hypothetical protein
MSVAGVMVSIAAFQAVDPGHAFLVVEKLSTVKKFVRTEDRTRDLARVRRA